MLVVLQLLEQMLDLVEPHNLLVVLVVLVMVQLAVKVVVLLK